MKFTVHQILRSRRLQLRHSSVLYNRGNTIFKLWHGRNVRPRRGSYV